MALPNFPIDKAYLIGGWLASAFWGAFTVVIIIWILSLSNRREVVRNYFPVAALLLMYVLATSHISLVLDRLIQAFVVHVNDDGGAILYLANIATPLNRSKDMLYVSLIVLGDMIIVWRCFMVWNKNYYVVALPVIMVLGTAISGYGAIGRYFTPDPYETASIRWAQAMLSVSMVTNIIVTLLTAGRIWYLSRSLGAMSFGPSQTRYRSVILLILESGMFMSISKMIEFILFQLAPDDGLDGLNALYIPMDCMPQIMGICPAFIMLAVSRGLTSEGTEAYGGRHVGTSTLGGPGTTNYVLKPMAFATHQSATRTGTSLVSSDVTGSKGHLEKDTSV
ncbi:hypothetical protein BDZ97DRAFT_1790714 [Flammula alnicola]|nr:hypothetical protein BDZ97DRAFT_1915862 [Flammula alnicola]KAF8970722.1 hypothetical protein BDZ97DRAFT_1790714 [Flammula alnicola]